MEKGRVKKVILAIGIAIVFAMFVAYAIESFYPSPKYEDYCNSTSPRFYNTQVECEANGGQWNPYQAIEKPVETNVSGYCNPDFTCSKNYEDTRKPYERNVFFINLGIGIVLVVISALFLTGAVAVGFLGGSIILIIYSTTRYWSNLSDVWRTLMLAFALGVLVWIGYKKLK